jgi:hypothetical protein
MNQPYPKAKPTLEQRISAALTTDLPSVELGERLLTRYRERHLQEQAAEWRGLSADIINEGTKLAAEMREVYAAAVGKLVDVFTRIADYKRRRDALYSRRPDQIGDQLPDPELLARGLDGFTINTPSLLEATKLFDLETGQQIWPDPQQTNRLAVEMSSSVRAMVSSMDRDACTPNWWKAVARRQAAAAAEAELQGERFAEMKRAQEERENREAAENWRAAHGTR